VTTPALPPRHHHGEAAAPRNLQALLEAIPRAEAGLQPRAHRLKWRPAADPACEDDYDWAWDGQVALRSLQELPEHENPAYARASASGSSSKSDKEWANLITYLETHGECMIGSLPTKVRKTKKQLDKRPDLFVVRNPKEGCYVRLVGTEPGPKGSSGGASSSASQVSKKAQPLVDYISKYLSGKRVPVGLGELGSQAKVKNLLSQQKGQMQRIRHFLEAHGALFELSEDRNAQVAVQLCGTNSGSGGGKGGKSSRSGAAEAHSGPSGRGGGLPPPPSSGKGGGRKGASSAVLDERISNLCGSSPVLASDFDKRVCGFLREIQDKQGINKLDDSFDFLSDWLSKKAHREEIGNWPGYIMKLLTTWRNENGDAGLIIGGTSDGPALYGQGLRSSLRRP